MGNTRARKNTPALHTNSKGTVAEDWTEEEMSRGIPTRDEEHDRPGGKKGRSIRISEKEEEQEEEEQKKEDTAEKRKRRKQKKKEKSGNRL